MSEEKEPFQRLMLKKMNPKKYIKKIENVIVSEGKIILDSIRRNYIIVNDERIGKFLEKYPDFKKICWRQLGFYHAYETGLISGRQYRLLMTMKQILNKNGSYILREDQFELRKKVLDCQTYNQVKGLCYQRDCPCFVVCPKHYKNDEKYWSEELSKGPATRNETEHLLHCKGEHCWKKLFKDGRDFLVCKNTGMIVDLAAMNKDIAKRLEGKP